MVIIDRRELMLEILNRSQMEQVARQGRVGRRCQLYAERISVGHSPPPALRLRTIHKSQSSEYPAAVIPVVTQHYLMLQRNPLYTGVTRGKRLVVLVGQRKAIAIAIRGVSGRRRWSKLREWLRGRTQGAKAHWMGRMPT